MENSNFKKLCILLVAILLTACGGSDGGSGGGGSSSSINEELTGVFVDSPVEGLKWESGDMAGTTDVAGTFQYKSGATVQFYVGDILIGEAIGNSVLTPIDLVASAQDITDPVVTNIFRFLMTLDNDNNPSNGIEITEASADLALGETVDFAQSTSDFAASGDIQVLIATLTSATETGARSLISVSVALNHAENTITDLIAGTYNGSFSGDDSGTWTGTVDASGVFTGKITSSTGPSTFAGLVSTTGSGSTELQTSGGTSGGSTFSGTFNTDGTVTGTWSWFGEDTGRWSGSKGNLDF